MTPKHKPARKRKDNCDATQPKRTVGWALFNSRGDMINNEFGGTLLFAEPESAEQYRDENFSDVGCPILLLHLMVLSP